MFTFLINEGDVTGATAFLLLSAFNVDIIPRAGAHIMRPRGKKEEEKAYEKRRAELPIQILTQLSHKSKPKSYLPLTSFNVEKMVVGYSVTCQKHSVTYANTK